MRADAIPITLFIFYYSLMVNVLVCALFARVGGLYIIPTLKTEMRAIFFLRDT